MLKLYRQSKWPDCPAGIKDEKYFHDMIVLWTRVEDTNGPEALHHRHSYRNSTQNGRHE